MKKHYERHEIEEIIVNGRGIKPQSAKKKLSYWIYGRKTTVNGKEYYLKPLLSEHLHYVRNGSKFLFTEEGERRIRSLF